MTLSTPSPAWEQVKRRDDNGKEAPDGNWYRARDVDAARAADASQIADLQEQLEQEKVGAGINNAYGLAAIEVWEKRALAAEAQVAALSAQKKRLRALLEKHGITEENG